ncbi:hypothetical protein [Rhizobium tibeticum]|uniref:hypothetical protein n=1 Tax=Rhizobium tibeticum TaxID=501024 RepID=UPI000A810F8E|nr:hypothetical protein [Rhizobium tibeticum]
MLIAGIEAQSEKSAAVVRRKSVDITDGVTVQIFRLIETVMVDAVQFRAEPITLESWQ